MFGSFNIGTDYTFTQSDTQNATASAKPDSSKPGASNVSDRGSLEAALKRTASSVSRANNSRNSNVSSAVTEASYLYNSDGKAASITNSFDALAAAVGGVGGKVTKEQLIDYLHSITANSNSSAANLEEVTFIKGLIAQFDTLSGHSGYITSFEDIKEPQDYKTVTKDQVTPPIDIRV